MTRVSVFRLLLGIALGLIFGLYYAWDVSPRLIKLSSPNDLSLEFQDEYRTLLSAAYANSNDLNRAMDRLSLLPDPNPGETLFSLSQEYLAAGRPQAEIQALALLASDLAERQKSTITPTSNSLEPAITLPLATPFSAPSPSPVPTESPSFVLLSLEKLCDPEQIIPLIQILALNSTGEQLPGIEFVAIWDSGEDYFFTGMKAELGIGYADFEMRPNIAYTVDGPGKIEPVSNLQVEDCPGEQENRYPGSWRLTFKEP